MGQSFKRIKKQFYEGNSFIDCYTHHDEFASCTAESSDPVDNSSSTYFLERTYGARSVTYEENNSDNLNLNDLPAISLKEADEILSNLRKHTNAKEEHNILAADKGNQGSV